MSDTHGRFIWYELMTPDIGAAKTFYRQVLGWNAQEMPAPGGGGPPYTIFDVNGVGVGGGMPMMPDVPAPNWTAYVAVDDVDASAARVPQLGGQLFRAPMDIPGIGRFAVIADPAGAVIAIMTPAPMDQPRPDLPEGAAGGPAWHELYGGDPAETFGFYQSLFGWKKLEAHDMGPMGVYQLFGNPGQVGGMMKKPPQVPAAGWTYYFRVGGIDDAASRIKSAGGTVTNGPMEVPGGDWVAQATDPQGAAFAVLGTKS